MKFVGYGYRKNCFGESMFFEDEMLVYSREQLEKVLAKSFDLARHDQFFSFKFICETDGQWAISCSNEDRANRKYSVVFSSSWNNTEAEKKMTRQAITNWILHTVYDQA